MSQKRICASCQEVIDETVPFYTLSGQKVVGSADGTLTAVRSPVALDFHDGHLPPGTEHFADDEPLPTEP